MKIFNKKATKIIVKSLIEGLLTPSLPKHIVKMEHAAINETYRILTEN